MQITAALTCVIVICTIHKSTGQYKMPLQRQNLNSLLMDLLESSASSEDSEEQRVRRCGASFGCKVAALTQDRINEELKLQHLLNILQRDQDTYQRTERNFGSAKIGRRSQPLSSTGIGKREPIHGASFP